MEKMKKTVLSYKEWILQESKKLESSLERLGSSIEATKKLSEALIKKEGFTDEEKMFLYILKESEMSIFEWQEEMINEGFLDKLSDIGKKLYDKGKDTIEDVKSWAGQQIEGIPEFFKALSSGIKNLSKMILDLFTKIFESVFKSPVDYTKKALGSSYNEIEKKTKEVSEKEPEVIKKEAKAFIEIVKATPKALSPKLISDKFNDAMQKSDNEKVEDSKLEIIEEGIKTSIINIFTEAINNHSVEEIKEGLLAINLSEGEDHHTHGHTEIPFVSTISGMLEKIPPFSWLHKLADFLGENTNKFLTNLSKSYKENGIVKEVVEFALLGSLIGIGLEVLVKGSTKSAILYFFPVLKTTLTVIGAIATGIAIIHIASTVIDGLKDSVEELEKVSM